jgi:surfactin synthase thioesterase subunit
MAPLVEALTAELGTDLTDRYALFGHSMGALVAFELARRFRDEGHPAPVALFASAHRAPHLPDPYALGAHGFDDHLLTRHLRELSGTPEEVLGDPELRALVLPAVRADFAVCETYEFTPGRPLDCPLVSYLPADDERIGLEHVLGWGEHSTGPFEVVRLRGGHFFLGSDPGELLADIASRLRQHGGCSPATGVRPGGAARPGDRCCSTTRDPSPKGTSIEPSGPSARLSRRARSRPRQWVS